jgi:NAD(P)-dependent dehydrogenase (short-subunit alcohol dehydrogenase family)
MASSSGRLAGQVAIVTGAGSVGEGFGTGKAISVLFARAGARVVLVDREESRAADTRGLIEAEGGEAVLVAADIADPSSWELIVGTALDRFGTVGVLVNNAALANTIGILDTGLEDLQEIIAVNLVAPFMLTKTAIPVMVRDGGGSIIYISSVAGLRGQGGDGRTAYAATKSAMTGMTVDLADAFGRQGIRVNTIAPGLIATPHRAHLLAEQGLDEASFHLADKTCLGVEGDSWDVANAALFLASPEGRYLTGVVLPVDGGSISRSH